ncbi:MAG TPA: tetratricopeptide repeat protein, partial [Terriglobia bacterium]
TRCSSAFPPSGEAVTNFDPGATVTPLPPAGRSPWTAPAVSSQSPDGAADPGPNPASWLILGAAGTLQPGSDFGSRYRIESLLGRGGMGAVYKAYDKDLDRMVALKLVRPELTNETQVMQRFKQELLLASRVSHKNVLRIHDLGDVNGLKFISMAYIDGEDLHHVLETHGRMAADEAVDIAQQLCGALQAAHGEGVIHRDLKPQNILIDHSGNAYISDFGLAKSLEASSAMMTRTGALLGTPRYMSPEQVEGKPADHRSDLYALGLIMYEMVTGDLPFTGDSVYQVMYQRLREDPKDPKLVNPDVPNYLSRVIMRCLERDPERRYQSAHDVLHDLNAPRTSLSFFHLPAFLPRRRYRRWLLAAGAALLVATLALMIPATRKFLIRSQPAAGKPAAIRGVPSLDEGKYVAVLPFRVLGASSLGYLGDGLRDALSAKLFQLQGIHIASEESVQQAAKSGSLEKIASELGANLIVEGTIQQAPGRIAIVANLHDITNGKLVWSNEFPGVPQDVLTLEDEIYTELVSALNLKPSNEEMARASRRPTENEEAYDLYLKGRDAMRDQQNPKNVETAIDYYNQALQKDPGFALAYAGTADASLRMYSQKKDRFWAQKALAAAQQAQRLNNNLPEVHSSLGSIYSATGKTAEAIAELDRALKLAPNSDESYRRLGGAYLASGRTGEAIQVFERAVQLNPYYWLNYNSLGQAYFQTGDYGKALAAWRKITELEPDNALGYSNIGAVYLTEGKYDQCLPPFQKALELQPNADIYSNLGTAYFYLGRYEESVNMFEKATEMNPNEETLMANLADGYRWSGQKDKANATYDNAISLAYKELEVNPRNAVAMQGLALDYAKKGDSTQGQDYIKRARAIDPDNVDFISSEAVVELLAGHTDGALKALREAFEKGYSTEQARNDPELKSLQGNPEFEKLVKQFSSKPK